VSDWARVDLHEPDIEVVTRRGMLDQGHADEPALTEFTMFLSDDSGPKLAIRVLNVARVAELVTILKPRSLNVICGRDESEYELLSNICTLTGTVLH
jgi:hypothetical protein